MKDLKDSEVVVSFNGSFGDKNEIVMTRRIGPLNKSESFHSCAPETSGICSGCCFNEEKDGGFVCSIPMDLEHVVSDYCNRYDVIFKRLEVADDRWEY